MNKTLIYSPRICLAVSKPREVRKVVMKAFCRNVAFCRTLVVPRLAITPPYKTITTRFINKIFQKKSNDVF